MIHASRRQKLSIAVALMAACWAGFPAAQGAVSLTEQGQPRAVIVHNGHTALPTEVTSNRDAKSMKPPADTLNHYLKQMTGTELPVVATLAEAEGKPARVE